MIPVHIKKNVLLLALFFIAVVFAGVVCAKSTTDSDQLDEQDREEFNLRIESANACVKSRDFTCAERQLNQARSYVNGSRDRAVLQKAMESLALQQQFALRDDARGKYAEERAAVESNAANSERELAASRKRANTVAAESTRRVKIRQAERDREDEEHRQQSSYDPMAGLRQSIDGSNRISDTTNKFVANINQRAAAEAQARAHMQQEYREQEAKRRRDAEHDRSVRVTSADAQRERDQRAERERAREAEQKRQREEQAAAERHAREQEQARLQEERRQQEARAAEEARAKQRRQADYLVALRQGIRLRAATCMGGEGKYYVTGSMPGIKKELECVDVYYEASCPGSVASSRGVITTFVPGGCLTGDASVIDPKPACAAGQVRVEVSDVRAGCK